MKLEKKWPDQTGWHWCWKMGMDKPAMHFAFPKDGRCFLEFTNDRTVFDVHVKETGYTHFAGPVKAADLPESEQIEVIGVIGDMWESKECGCVYQLILPWSALPPIPSSFRGGQIKIALEKIIPDRYCRQCGREFPSSFYGPRRAMFPNCVCVCGTPAPHE